MFSYNVRIAALVFSAVCAFGQNRIDSQSEMHISFPEDSPLAVVKANWGDSLASPRGGAMLLDLHVSLGIKNTGQQRVRSVTLLVKSQDFTPGGKASVSIPSLNVGRGEVFPVRIDLRLLRPLQQGNGPLVEIGLDGILFDDLSFYGPNVLNCRRSMLVWEYEARRDRKYFKSVLGSSGQDALQDEMLAGMRRQAERGSMEAQVSQLGRATNTSFERPVQFAFLETPDAPVTLRMGKADVAGDEARAPKIHVENRSDRQVREMEIGWMVNDADGKQFMAGSLPIDVRLAPHQQSFVNQSGVFKFAQPNGKAISIDRLTGYLSSVEFEDGQMWIPARNGKVVNPSPEEQRLVELYRKKGIRAVVEELHRF